jgi:pentatricopeptide repeat protein
MQSICHLSRRWHQQFCRSPSFDHQQCLLQWRSYRQPSRRPAPDDDLVVREYEQLGDASTRKRIDNPLEDEEKKIRQEIKRLERESALLRQNPFKDDAFLRSLPEHDRQQLLQALEAEVSGDDFDELLDDDDLDVDDVLEQTKPKSLGVTLRIPAKHKSIVRRFNSALEKAQKEQDPYEKRNLWIWYLRCQQMVPGFSNFVSEDVWDYLWETQMEIYSGTRHIVVLGRDMQKAGIEMDKYLAGYLEALHATGETSTALELWEANETCDPRLGVKLYAAVGRPSRAQEIAMATALDAETVLPVFEAWANSKKSNAPARLWAFYLQVKQKEPQVDLLGQITSLLLKAGRREMALAVFKDMLASKDTSSESMRIFQSLMGDAEPTEEAINRIGLTALLSLPRTVNNKFFFGAWVKWLLGANKVNDAGMVVELMQERGVKPDARVLNGMIGAWIRDGSKASVDRAEQMAWGMINARIQKVEHRGRSLSNSELDTIDSHFEEIKRLPRFMQRQIPSATIETFSIILLRYIRQGDFQRAEQLTQIMTGPAQIKPNSFILNHWLYLSLRNSDVDAMWQRFKSVQDEIKPDLETFTYLWDGERRNLNLPRRSSVYPTPRQLYKEMVEWHDALSSTKQEEVRGQFSVELYEQIIRCFCLHSDLPCTFHILHDMHTRFGLLPQLEIASMVVMQVARMMPGDQRAARPRRAARRRSDEFYRAAMSNFAGLMNEIFLRKAEAAMSRGVDVDVTDEKDTEVARALRLEAIQTFICLIMMKQAKQGSHVDNDLVVASRALGIEGDKAQIKEQLEEALEMYEGETAEK